MCAMGKKKLRQKLSDNYGALPNFHYFEGDMGRIRSYFDYRWDNDKDPFLIDDITAEDLDLDRVFRRVNNCQSTSGEQYLYHMLRSPCTDRKSYDKRRSLIEYTETNPESRLSLQMILAGLGRNRKANVSDAFSPKEHGVLMLLVYSAMALALVFCIACFAITQNTDLAAPVFGLLILNITTHETRTRKLDTNLATVNYSVGMVFAARRIKKTLGAELESELTPMYEAANQLKSLLRVGMVSLDSTGTIEDIFNSMLLIDLISYEFLKSKLGRHHKDIFTLHEHVGMLDAAISISSYRKSLDTYCEPEIDFSSGEGSCFCGTNLSHPLITKSVPNSLDTKKPVLVTGSNASGKSTYLKTIALSAILSQSICTCLGSEYRATAFRIFSSMAISDDLLAGESYYISEIKSLKRILDYLNEGEAVLCVVDEVLRGTNTLERIAASSEVLHALAAEKVICVAATHDIELCTLLRDIYNLSHFEEHIDGSEMTFDYKVKPGPATSRNAIKLLGMMGFDDSLVSRANQRAQNYTDTGLWKF